MDNTDKIVIFGTGQFSETVSYYLKQCDSCEIIGYCVDREFLPDEDIFLSKPIVAWEDLETVFPPTEVKLFGPISFRNGNRFRRDRYLEGKKKGYAFYTYVHPNASIHADKIGENCLILEQNVIQPFVKIGDNVIIWNSNHIGHHSVIGDHCFLAGMVGIAGNCQIDALTFMGGQSGVGDNVRIGEGSILGFGVSVLSDLAPDTIVLPQKERKIEGAAAKFARRLL